METPEKKTAMDEGMQGMLVLLATSIVTAIIVHCLMRRHLLASFVSAGVASVVFQLFAYLHLGYLDPFFIIALIVGAAVSFGISLVVGLPFLWLRNRQDQLDE